MRSKPVRVVKDLKYSNMWRLEWENGDLSEDFYNLSRAHDILRNYDLYRKDMKKAELEAKRASSIQSTMPRQASGKPADAFK